MRQRVSKVSDWFIMLSQTQTILVLALMFFLGIAVILWHMSRLSSNLIESAALHGTSLHSQSLEELRKLYTSDVVNRVVTHGVEVTHDYAAREGAIPLPATFTLELGKRLGDRGSGIQVRLYSDYPFPWRTDGGPRDDFEREALRQLRQYPDRPFSRVEEVEGRRSLRYATADLMRAGCVTCHNSHPDSPKTDWKEGDVRGVLQISRPLDSLIAETSEGLRGTFILMGTMTVVGLIFLGLMIGRLRRTSTELAQHARDLEGEITVRQQMEMELRRAKEAAEAANIAKSHFLATMSHELRTPLNHIIGYSDMLQEEAEERGIKDFTPDLRKIQAAGQQLLSLITDVLDLSTIEAGEMKVHLETFDVSSLIQDVVLETGPLAAKNANRLEVHSAEAVGTMRADRTKIRQCLLNLLSNACKFTERGTIILDVTREKMNGGDWITFRVSDTGIGISPEQIDKLFQVFSQIDASSTRKYGGTGLGLVICRKFCQMMGGDITVQSAVGQGSIFTIRLPAEVVASTVLKAEVSNACQQASI